MRISYLMKTKKEGVGPWRFASRMKLWRVDQLGKHSRTANRTKNSLVSHSHRFKWHQTAPLYAFLQPPSSAEGQSREEDLRKIGGLLGKYDGGQRCWVFGSKCKGVIIIITEYKWCKKVKAWIRKEMMIMSEATVSSENVQNGHISKSEL